METDRRIKYKQPKIAPCFVIHLQCRHSILSDHIDKIYHVQAKIRSLLCLDIEKSYMLWC